MTDRWLPRPRNQTSDFDVLMNALGAFIVLFALAIVIAKDQAKKKPEQPGYSEGLYRISIVWDNASDDDVDLYVRDPAGNIAYFQNKANGLMHLERDDRGLYNDMTTLPTGEQATVKDNQEHVIIRGTITGEYVVNVHMYRKASANETPVAVTLRRSRDNAVLTEQHVVLTRIGDEKTAFRFTINESGEVSGTNTLEIRLIGTQHPSEYPEDNSSYPNSPDPGVFR